LTLQELGFQYNERPLEKERYNPSSVYTVRKHLLEYKFDRALCVGVNWDRGMLQ